jgi:hypothetical protein
MSAAFLEIRTMTSTRKVLRSPDVDVGDDVDFVARVNMIAEVCHQFSQVFLAGRDRAREKLALAAIEWRWMASPPEARAWILRVLAEAGISIEDVIDLPDLEIRLESMRSSTE